ncbi:PPR domain-containing protein/PPR_2 domain-containing protein/DYW_deaminase domain-containing protein, partial [Cephalotus follicularis]
MYFSPPSPMDDEPEDQGPGSYNEQTAMTFQQKEEYIENNVDLDNIINNIIGGNSIVNGNKMVDENSVGDGNNGSTPFMEDINVLKAIPPGYFGEGLPYAPIDWPNPGDIWGWCVGRRATSAGYYQDRFLLLPKRLQKPHSPKQRFGSKSAVARYIETEIPGADIDAFFASFSWKIPSTKGVSAQAETEGVGKEGKEEVSTRRREKRKAAMPPPIKSPPTKSPAAKSRDVPKRAASKREVREVPRREVPKRKTRRSGGRIDSEFFDEEAGMNESNKGLTMETPAELSLTPEEFDEYLNALDDIIDQPIPEAPLHISSPVLGEEIIEARSKLSSLLDMDFPSLFGSKKLNELTNLAFILRKDPNLSAEQLVKLKLIEEIPSFSEVFLENRVIAEQADNFFESLEANKAKVTDLKKEYSELKEQVGQLQAEVDSNMSTVKEIDEEIAKLQARRAELTHTIETMKKKKVKLTTTQDKVAKSIPRVVQEIQVANSKRPEWELKKENAGKREAEILDKFIPLKGFALIPSKYSDKPGTTLLAYQSVRMEGANVDRFSFPPLLKAAARVSWLTEGMEIHGLAAKLGFANDQFVQTGLVRLYASCGRILDARLMFDKISHRDVVTWSTMIDGSIVTMYANCGCINLAKKFYDNISPKNMFISTAMVSGYSKLGRVQDARLIFDNMVEKDLVCWSAMISGYAESDQPQEALNLFSEMQVSGIQPDEVNMLGVISACGHLGVLEQAKQIHKYADKNGFGGALPINNALIDMYAKCGSLERACVVFEKMLRRNVISWTSMISAFAMHGDACNAISFFNKMKYENVEPNGVTFVGVLYACSHAGLVDEGRNIFASMINEHNISPKHEHYGCMVDLFGRAGLLREALDLVETMPLAPNIVIWGSLMAACQIHAETELGEFAAKQILELEPNHDGALVTLSNIYAKGKRNHKQSDQIYEKLDEVVRDLKLVGYAPNTSSSLVDLEEEEKRKVVVWHSEKLALCYGLLSERKESCIRIVKNLRVCEDCHAFMKLVSKVYEREIVVRD